MSNLVELLRAQAMSDHARDCGGRQYSCECGYDIDTERLLARAADHIEALEAALREISELSVYSHRFISIALAAIDQKAST